MRQDKRLPGILVDGTLGRSSGVGSVFNNLASSSSCSSCSNSLASSSYKGKGRWLELSKGRLGEARDVGPVYTTIRKEEECSMIKRQKTEKQVEEENKRCSIPHRYPDRCQRAVRWHPRFRLLSPFALLCRPSYCRLDLYPCKTVARENADRIVSLCFL